jgi:hypothetical protein
MLHKITGVMLFVTLVLMLLARLVIVIDGTAVIIGIAALFVASCVIAAANLVRRRAVTPTIPSHKASPSLVGRLPEEPQPESPMQRACRYMRQADELAAQGKIDEAIATYREGEEQARKDMGAQHAMVFMLCCAARDLEERYGKTPAKK